MNECVCVRDTERDCCCVFEFVNQYAIILWSPEVLPVAVITCADIHTDTQTHTLTQQSLFSLVSMSRQLCPGQTMLFILMMPPQSQMQPDINTWPSAKQTVPHSRLCLSQPTARSAMINPGVMAHSNKHTVWVSFAVNTSRQECVGMSVSTWVTEMMMSPWKEFPHLLTDFLLVVDVDWSVITTVSAEVW